MPIKGVSRSASLLPGQHNRPNENTLRVDSDTEELVHGTGASGTTERKVPNSVFATYSMLANGSLADQSFFVATRAYQVIAISEVHSVAGNDAGAVNLQVTKDTGTNAPGAGTNLLTDNSNAGFNLKGTANTVQTGTLSATESDLQLAAGDRLSVDFAGTLTTLAGVTVTVELRPI